MLISINTRWCSQEQADSFFSFTWKKYLLQSDKGKPWSNKMQQQQGKTNWCHLPKSRNLKNDDQDWPQWDWGDVWFSGVFFKVWHILVTSLLFAFKNLFHCVCWPVMHEKCCDACPVLVLHAERAEEWQLLMVHQAQSPSKQRLLSMSKNTWEMEPKEVQNLLPLQMAEIQLSFCLTDGMKSRLQSRQGNLFLELSKSKQSKFRRPEQELHCYLHLITSYHEGWSLRCVNDAIIQQ